MIEVVEISRNFGRFQAVNNVSFHVQKGEVLGFLGPNGAGKSTTMKMLTGYLQPSSGDALICGHSVTKQSIKARAEIGYLPESAPSYGEMQVEEFLRFAGKVRGLTGGKLNSQIEKVIEDTIEDFKLIREVLNHFKGRSDFSLEEIINFLDNNPEIIRSNQNITRRWKEYRF